MASFNEYAMTNINELKRDPISALHVYCTKMNHVAWKMEFHKEIIERMKTQFFSPSEAADNEMFLRYVHDILKAWYGKRSQLIIDFDDKFKIGVKKAAVQLDCLKDLRIENIGPTDVGCVTDTVWRVIENLKITNKEARIVSGTKAIHHLIPDLVPPMDVKYAGTFFRKHHEIGQINRQQSIFGLIFSAFVDLARYFIRDSTFRACVGTGYNTSLPKALDNAIIGFVAGKLGEQPRTCS